MKPTTKGLILNFVDKILPGRAYVGDSRFYDGTLSYGASKAGVSVNETTALNSVAVWACVRILSETLASLPLFLYRRMDHGRERALAHRLYGLLHDQPNPEMTSFTWRETMMSHLVMWGNAYALIDYEDLATVSALWPLMPDRMTVTRDTETQQVVYRYQTSNGQVAVPAFRVLHIPGLGFDGLLGYSPIRMAREAIGLSLATEEFGARFFSQGTNTGGFLEHPQKLSDNAYERLKKSMKDRYEGLSNAARLMILEEGMKFERTTIPPEDAQFLETRKFQRSEIAGFFHIPPHMIGDLERATFGNIEQQSLEFVVYTMRPWLVRWEQAIHAKLINPIERSSLFAEFLVDGLLRGDVAARGAYYNTMFQIGAFSRNDIREKENMNPIPGGDETYIPLNMVPASQAGFTPTEEPMKSAGSAELKAARTRAGLTRSRTAGSFKGVFQEAGARIVGEERRAVLAAARKHLGGKAADAIAVAAFRTWLDEYYKSFPALIAKRMRGPANGLAEAIEGLARDEVNAGRLDTQAKVRAFVADYIASFSVRYTGSSQGQLTEVLRAAEPLQAVEDRLDEWEETRPGKIAMNETVQLANAVAKVVFVAAGITRLRWSAIGADTCEFCNELDGQVVGIEQNFRGSGSEIDAEGRVMRVERNTAHPPIHGGCQCQIVPD